MVGFLGFIVLVECSIKIMFEHFVTKGDGI